MAEDHEISFRKYPHCLDQKKKTYKEKSVLQDKQTGMRVVLTRFYNNFSILK